MEVKQKWHIRPVLAVAFGACAFLMLYPAAWWVGFSCAVAALVVGVPGLKKEERKDKAASIAGLLSAVAAAIAYVGAMIASGFMPVSTF